MRKLYEKPMIKCEEFMANEYVAACGEGHTVYKFKCDAISHSILGDGGRVWIESNGKPGLQRWTLDKSQRDTFRSYYHPCGETHEAEAIEGNFQRGYLTTYDNRRPIDVIVWTGLNDDNTHCTTNLDMDSWETAKS